MKNMLPIYTTDRHVSITLAGVGIISRIAVVCPAEVHYLVSLCLVSFRLCQLLLEICAYLANCSLVFSEKLLYFMWFDAREVA